MNKFIPIVVLVLGFVFGATAQAKDCSAEIKKAGPYKGVIATVSQVSSQKVSGKDAIFYADGLRYDFVYAYPNGYNAKTFSVLPPDGKFKIADGDKMIWIPASPKIRDKYPKEDRHIPAIVGKDCRIFGVDFSTPAEKIVGL